MTRPRYKNHDHVKRFLFFSVSYKPQKLVLLESYEGTDTTSTKVFDDIHILSVLHIHISVCLTKVNISM